VTALLTLASALLAASVAAVVTHPPALARLGRTSAAGGRGASAAPPGALGRVVLLAAVTGVLLLAAGVPVTLVLLAPAAAAAVRVAHRRHRRLARARRTRDAVVEACGVLASTLQAGSPPDTALRRVAADVPALGGLLTPAVTAARLGGDVPGALSRAAGAPGADGLHRLAACWAVATGSGASVAPLVDRVARGLRAHVEHRRAVAAQLAGPRATARLLALLPVFGLALGSAVGADPLDVLLGSPFGLACLAVGLLLDTAGLLWVETLARRAEAEP
jgi:tight adherence protein B